MDVLESQGCRAACQVQTIGSERRVGQNVESEPSTSTTMASPSHRGKAFVDGRESLKAVPSWTSWRVKGVASTTRAHPSHGGKAFVDSRESLKAVPSWTSRRSRIRSVKIVSEVKIASGGSKSDPGGSCRRVKIVAGSHSESQNRIRMVKAHPESHSGG